MQGRVSQNFDLGPSYHFMKCIKKYFENILKISQKLPVFLHKIKTKTKINILRHASL